MEDMGQTLSHQGLKQIAYDMWGKEDLESFSVASRTLQETATTGTLRIFHSNINLACVVALRNQAYNKREIKELD